MVFLKSRSGARDLYQLDYVAFAREAIVFPKCHLRL